MRYVKPALVSSFFLISFSLLSACSSNKVYFHSASDYEPDEADLAAYFSTPDNDPPFPAIVLFPGCQGLARAPMESLQAHSSALNDAGYATLIVDSYSTRWINGDTVCQSNRKLAEARLYRTNDAHSAYSFLSAKNDIDADNIFFMGQSNGGSVALKLASSEATEYSAIAAYYPWCSILSTQIEVPLIVFGGSEDDWTPPGACQRRHDIVRGAEYKFYLYEGAPHSFDLPISRQTYAGHTVGWDGDATRESRERMIEFFDKHTRD